MHGSFILDSNIAIGILRGNQKIIAYIGRLDNMYVPTIVMGELYEGAYKSKRVSENITQLEAFQQRMVIIPLTLETAKCYGLIKNELRQKGKPIPVNDIWIAALALERKLPILTNDHHFLYVSQIEAISI